MNVRKGTLVTYTDTIGGTEQVWNARDGVVPDVAVTVAGRESRLSSVDGVADAPAAGQRVVVTMNAKVAPTAGTRRLGWPGEPVVT